MKSNSQILTNILLAGILAVLFLIWQRMPPVFGDLIAAKGDKDAVAAVVARQPLVHANFSEPIRVDAGNKTLSVRVVDTPFEVHRPLGDAPGLPNR